MIKIRYNFFKEKALQNPSGGWMYRLMCALKACLSRLTATSAFARGSIAKNTKMPMNYN